MAQATLRKYVKNFAKVSSETPNTHVDVSVPGPNLLYTDYVDGGDLMLFQVDDPTSSLGTKRLYDMRAVFSIGTRTATTSWIKALLGDYDPDTVTWNTKPEIYDGYMSFVGGGTTTVRADKTFTTLSTAAPKSEFTKLFLKNLGGIFVPTQKSYTFELYTTLTDNSTPYVEFVYDDEIDVTGHVVYKSGPSSGYANPRSAISFGWGYEKTGDYYCAGDFVQTSAVFYWKDSESENYTAVNISGNQQGVTIPANTFPTGKTIQWYVQGTESSNTTSQTTVYSFSTAAGEVTSSPISPISTVESNNEEITFEWSYTSADGFPPSRYILKWREISESSWNNLVDSQTAETSYTAPANIFPAGEIRWVVLPYNIDGVAGTGTIASFISFGAPEAPTVTVTEVPYLTVSWQAEDQQAYKITVDSKTYGPYFGTEKQFELPEYLEDGTHTITVNIMGTYALWSPGGSTTVTIANEPGEAIELSTENGIEPRLAWSTEEATGDFYIYRNGKLIGHTTEMYFFDRFAEGECSYKVVNRLPSGNYSISDPETANVQTEGAWIADLNSGGWIQIEYSRTDQRDPEYTETVETVYDHLAGDEFPSAIIGSYRDTSMSFSALFLASQTTEQNAFRSLFGRPVIMKIRDGSVYTGIIDAWTRKPYRTWYTEYSFTLRRITFEDYIDDTT